MLHVSSLSWKPNSKTKQILNDISILVSEGDLVVFVGANGSGKSSLLRSMSGWLKPTKGSILLNHKSIQEYSSTEKAQWVGLLPQRMQLSENISISEWLSYSRFRFSESHHKRKQRIAELLENQKLAHLGSRSFHQLSGGEAQRILLLGLMAQESNIWLLDEPANHLDPRIQMEIYQKIISQWQHGTTLILITHNINLLLRTVPDAQKNRVRIIGIQDGSILFEEKLNSKNLVEQISNLYQLPAQMVQVFGCSQIIFGIGT